MIKLPDIFSGSIDKNGLCADAILEPTKKDAPLIVDFQIPGVLERVEKAKRNAERRNLED